jgi:serine/threonine protein kinase
MRLLTTSSNCSIIKVYLAFQDQQFLYLVTEALDSVSFETLLEEHCFSEDETRYVVSTLLGILDYVHARGYALTQLSPKDICFDRRTGQLKVTRL